MDFFLITFGIVLVFILMFSVWRFFSLNSQKKKKIIYARTQFKKIQTSNLSPREKILEYDKVLDMFLSAFGHTGTTGNKMKTHGKRFKNQNNIWYAHKMRNRVAHEIGFRPSDTEFKKAQKYFQRELY